MSFELHLATNQLAQPTRLQNQHIHTYMHTNQLQRIQHSKTVIFSGVLRQSLNRFLYNKLQ